MTTAPLPPAAVTRPVVIEVPSPIRRTPFSSRTEERSPVPRAAFPRPREQAMSWLMVAAIAGFSGVVAALLTRWWMG